VGAELNRALLVSQHEPGLQQLWTLLLVDVVFHNFLIKVKDKGDEEYEEDKEDEEDDGECYEQSLQGCVVETYDRNQDRDCFAEHKKTASSAPDGTHRYRKIKVCTISSLYGISVITLGTRHECHFHEDGSQDQQGRECGNEDGS
jgi:hypothetical protein